MASGEELFDPRIEEKTNSLPKGNRDEAARLRELPIFKVQKKALQGPQKGFPAASV